MIKASCPPGGLVLDPFMGSGTTAVAAHMLGRDYTGFEMNPAYCELIQDRLAAACMTSGASQRESEQDNEPA
jgi:site-specific DNA-methyltransferase (adenine-specific)